ncbi:MAG: HlyD family secretion protein [Candidatus Rokubacteria bacterium]|nr:HlyD family secretion protein [Candidatus Rokubacteria bacterium]
MKRRLLSLFVIVLVAAGATGVWFYAQGRGGTPKYRVARVERGPLTATVSATGNLNAVITVQVGSQVSGQIKELHADFNSQVKKDQLIAHIDPDLFEAKANQARADLENAQASVLNQTANLERARADVENARASLAGARAQTAKAQVALLDARRDLDRKTELLRKELISQSDKDTSQATHDSAAAQLESAQAQERALASQIRMTQAQLGVAEALLKAAHAQVKLKKAALDQALVDLAHTYIRAPVDGTVVSRNVDVGQTVAASLQAPTLFTIAQDLTQMQVDTSVDEADIGRIRVGDRVTFTVDAFPVRAFAGQVVQIRKAPQVVQNVVTYNVVVGVQNPDLKLLPGMTANVKVVVNQKPSVLKVPNAALRFRPQGVQGDGPPRGGPQGRPGGGPGAQVAQGRGPAGRVWVVGPDGKPAPVNLQLGISDGSFTEVLDGEALREGQEVIVGSTERPTPPTGAPRLRL